MWVIIVQIKKGDSEILPPEGIISPTALPLCYTDKDSD